MNPSKPAPTIHIQIAEPFTEQIDPRRIKEQVRKTLATVAPDLPASLTILITGDAQIQALNRLYLGIDAPTDVLAFSQLEGPPLPGETGAETYLGDVVISYERAVEQAGQYQEPVERELRRLVVHGILHLLGYDDQDDAGRAEMWQLQEAILNQD